MSNKNKVRVGVRVRPQIDRELAEGANVCVAISRAERLVTVARDKQFSYNYVFGAEAHQEEVYSECVRDKRRDRDLLKGLFEGYNSTVFAYGQTGSGKTYTMGIAADTNEQTMGIIPRAARDLFGEIDERNYAALEQNIRAPLFDIHVQFIEIYNEDIVDLLADAQHSATGKIDICDQGGEVYLRGVVKRAVSSEHEVHEILRAGIVKRSTASTNMNEKSSRSHAIFTIMLKQTRVSEDDPNFAEELSAKFHFVDLAGSEGLRKTGATGDRAREGIHINKGLLDLGCVITALHEHAQHIPYRNGKLTQLLKDSLGGNSRTLMIACVSPNESDVTETVKTLNYALRAMSIRNKQARHFRLVSNQGPGAVEDTDSTSSGVAIPSFSDITNLPYSRAQWTSWYSEVSRLLPTEVPQIDIANEELPQIDGPDDIDALARIREIFSNRIARERNLEQSLEENAKILDAKLKERLCLADLDRARVVAQEEEIRSLKSEIHAKTLENRQLKRKHLALESRLRTYEAEIENGREQMLNFKRYIDQERAPEKDARRTLCKLAEMFESPIPTTCNVARLRKKFGDADAGEDEENQEMEDDAEGPSQRKTLKLAHQTAAVKSSVHFNNVNISSVGGDARQQYQKNARYPSRVPGAPYVNTKYQPLRRRSRSEGALRVLNHQPQNQVPLGTVFQPKLPRTTKHTTQPNAEDLKKHDEYLATHQEMDSHGNLQTKLFKGQVTPTAGGGSAVVYRDVENLFQESPAD